MAMNFEGPCKLWFSLHRKMAMNFEFGINLLQTPNKLRETDSFIAAS